MQLNAENELDYLMVFILSQNLLINGIISEDVFNSYPTKYFKVAIAKGILTMEDINAYIERYVPLM